MDESKDGGPAFPHAIVYSNEGTKKDVFGMTLRDYFAAKAMQSLIERQFNDRSEAVNAAYDWADAMLKARRQ